MCKHTISKKAGGEIMGIFFELPDLQAVKVKKCMLTGRIKPVKFVEILTKTMN